MNFIKINLAVIIMFSLLTGCGKSDNKTSDNKSSDQKQEVKTTNDQSQNTASGQAEVIEIKLPTMQCGTCKKNIEKAVNKLDGINSVNVVVKEKKAKITYDKSKTDLSKIEGAIVMAGYQANEIPANKDSYEKLDDCCKVKK